MVDRFVSAFGQRWGEAYAASGYLTVARDGQVLFARAYGKANRAHNRVADADTRFQLGSLTKQFTAAAIAQLAEKGLLRFEDPIRKYLPDYPRVGDTITIHQLLTHTSGIPEYEADFASTSSAPPGCAGQAPSTRLTTPTRRWATWPTRAKSSSPRLRSTPRSPSPRARSAPRRAI
jgi:CubicO group peptidase (beta-lactamase class C family)